MFEKWKKATITPVPKVAVPVKPTDYRPISVLRTLTPLFNNTGNASDPLVPLSPHCVLSLVGVPCGSVCL